MSESVAGPFPKLPTRALLGAALRALRKARGLSLGDMADASRLTVVAVSDLERGRQRDITTVRLYLDALDGLTSEQKMIYCALAELAWHFTPPARP